MNNKCNYCNMIDNLPFMCHACDKIFCRKHISKHECIELKDEPLVLDSKVNFCIICQNINNLKLCNTCDKYFCPKHISPWHKCQTWYEKFIGKILLLIE